MFENLFEKDKRSTIVFMPEKKRSTIVFMPEKKRSTLLNNIRKSHIRTEKAYVRGLAGGAFRGRRRDGLDLELWTDSLPSALVDRIMLGTTIYIYSDQKGIIYKVYRRVLYVSLIALIGVCLCVEI